MKIELEIIKPIVRNIDDFADQYGLTMVITERDRPEFEYLKYFAKFKNIEVSSGGMLESTYGNGSTPAFAIEDYQRKIAGKRLVHNAMTKNRHVFNAPKEFNANVKRKSNGQPCE